MAPIKPCVQALSKIDHAVMHPFFAWMPFEQIHETFVKTTQFLYMPSSAYLRKRHCSANPAVNVYHCQEADATDTNFSDTPAIEGGEKAAQLFVGRDTKLVSIHPMKGTDEQNILGAFQDYVCWYGAPMELLADNAAIYEGPLFMKYVCNLYIRL